MRHAIHKLTCWYLRRFPKRCNNGTELTDEELKLAKELMEFHNRHCDRVLKALANL